MTPRLHDGEPVDAFQSFDPDAYDPYQAPERCPGCLAKITQHESSVNMRWPHSEELALWHLDCAAREWIDRLMEFPDDWPEKLDKLAIGQLYALYLIRGKAHQEFEEVVA